MLKRFVYTSYGKRKKKNLFSRLNVEFQGHWAFVKNSGTWIFVSRIKQELCSLGCSNLVCPLHVKRERSLFILKVKGQGHWAFIKNSGTWNIVSRI